jgi:hypothetical protein
MRHPPTIALVALWPKQWSIYRDPSFKMGVFAGWSLLRAASVDQKVAPVAAYWTFLGAD